MTASPAIYQSHDEDYWNPLQFLANLRFSTLALTGPLANADRRWFFLLKYDSN
jgi:hypothetical protein